MIKTCPSCNRQRLRCVKCFKIGAFNREGYSEKPHQGECVYEDCAYCVEEAHKYFKKLFNEIITEQT